MAKDKSKAVQETTKDTIRENGLRVLHLARELQAQGKTWKQANDALFSPTGLATILFPNRGDRKKLVDSDIHDEISAIMASLSRAEEDEAELSGKFVVRLPKSLHRSLKAEAERENVSLNQLVLAKIAIDLHSAIAR